MAAPTKKDDHGIDLLYPDLLSKEGLLHNLRKRYILIPATDLETLDKESLVGLYNKYILPLPQRKYRDNLRGREMKRKQILKDKKRKFALPDDGDSISAKKKERLSDGNPAAPAKGLVNQSTSPTGNRLKPPPSCIDTSKKVIKLSSLSLSPTKQQEESSKSEVTATSNRFIKLNSNAKTNDTAVKRPVKDIQKEDEESLKKKFKAISWP